MMDVFEELFNMGVDSGSSVYMSLLAMIITTALSLVITKVYQITFTGERYSQAFVHTIIMMSVIISVVMNVVSGNAGVAFGLFAVFSLIRFRSAVTNAKDIAYIFFGLCVGMTAGLYQFGLAIVLTIFSSFIFYLLYKFQYAKRKEGQLLKVMIPENLNREDVLDDILDEFTISRKLRKVETTNLGTMILYTYAISCKKETKDKDLLDRIRERNANLKVSLSYLEEEE